MNADLLTVQLLRQRLAQSEASAPPAPRASQLLARARTWWEAWPEKFQSLARSLGAVQVGYGHAMVDAAVTPSAPLVPALVSGPDGEAETAVQILQWEVRRGELHCRFEADVMPPSVETDCEVTFVSEPGLQPLFSATARRTVAHEYTLDAALPADIAADWSALTVTRAMPFRLILRPASA